MNKQARDPDKDVCTKVDGNEDVVIRYVHLPAAIYNTEVHIEENMLITQTLYDNKYYSQALMYVSLVFEEVGRYYIYADALKNKKDITAKTMHDLSNHKFKLTALIDSIFDNAYKEPLFKVNKVLKQQFRNETEYHNWLKKRKESYRAMLRSLSAIKQLALYPHWWNGKQPQYVDLNALMDKKDLAILTYFLFDDCQSFAIIAFDINSTISSYKLFKNEIQQIDKKSKNNDYVSDRAILLSCLSALAQISSCMIKNKYDEDSEKRFSQLLARKEKTSKR